MGQSCFTIMLGCQVSDNDITDAALECLYDKASDFKPLPADVNEDIVGIEIAVGGSGRRGAADFNYTTIPFNENALAADPEIGPYLRAAQAAWPAFAGYITRETGIVLNKPGIWLTTTETA